MSKREIPATVTDHEVRTYLAGLAEHIQVLEKTHSALSDLAANKPLTSEQRELLKHVTTARNNLDSQWQQLTPTIAEALATGRFVITNK